MTIFCRKCSAGFACSGVFPITCPTCQQATTWAAESICPRVRYELTHNDRTFLHSLCIASEPKVIRKE